MKRKIYILIGIITCLIIVLTALVLKNKNQIVPGISPVKPDIKSDFSEKINITLSIPEEEFVFPSKLPVLSLSKKAIQEETVQNLANNLDLGSSVNQFEDTIEGKKYYVDNGSYFLVATPKKSLIKYGASSEEELSRTDNPLSEQDFKNIATDFFVQKGFYNENQIKPVGVKYLKKDASSEGFRVSNKNDADLVQINFSFGSGDYEIVSQFSTNPASFVQLTLDGKIYYSEAVLYESIQKSPTEYEILDYNGLAENINQSKLISFTGGYYSVSDLTAKDLGNIDVQNIKISYFFENDSENIQPVFILEGNAQSNRTEIESVILYLPAFR